jgi:hypothetical protein
VKAPTHAFEHHDWSAKPVIGLAKKLHGWQPRFGLTLFLLLLAFLVLWAHNGPAVDHMNTGDVVAICLAVAEIAVLGLGMAAVARPGRRPRGVRSSPPGCRCLFPASPTGPPARAGPEFLQVFRY